MLKRLLVKIQFIFKYSILVILVLFIGFYVFSLVRNYLKLSSTSSLVNEAEVKLDEARQKQKELLKTLDIMSSEEYKKRQAKEKLGYVEDGEIVVILPDEETLRKLSPRKVIVQRHELPDVNWKKWLKVFVDI